MTVLIISSELDRTADEVVLALTGKDVAVCRIDLSWFPQRMSLEAEFCSGRWEGWLRTAGGREVALTDIRSVWYRWRSAYDISSALRPADRDHARYEARAGCSGVLQSLDARYVNHPGRVDALSKPQELVLAARCGLRVPKTAVSNSPEHLHAFITAQPGPVVRKLFSCSVPDDGQGRAMVGHSRLVTEADLADLGSAVYTAHQVQSFVDKTMDVRVVAIGSTLFPISITALDPSARVDFRANYRALRFKRIDLPPTVEAGIRSYMAAAGLNIASLDFTVDAQDRWWFLESNPSGGQFQFLEAPTGAPIVETLATFLASPWEGGL